MLSDALNGEFWIFSQKLIKNILLVVSGVSEFRFGTKWKVLKNWVEFCSLRDLIHHSSAIILNFGEIILKAFEHINLLIMPSETQEVCFVTPLSPVQEHILALLGLPTSLYTSLELGDECHRLNQKNEFAGQVSNLPGPSLANCTTRDRNDDQLQLG